MLNTNDTNKTPIAQWNGVSFEELKFMRAKALIKLEMQKEHLKHKTHSINPFKQASGNKIKSSKLSFIQRILLFVQGVKMANSIIKLFKKK
jgi:hypothetical protein